MPPALSTMKGATHLHHSSAHPWTHPDPTQGEPGTCYLFLPPRLLQQGPRPDQALPEHLVWPLIDFY